MNVDQINSFLSPALLVLVGLGSLYAYYAFMVVYPTYIKDFRRNRTERGDSSCPSNAMPPDTKPWDSNREAVLDAADKHPSNFASCELLYPLKNAKVPKSKMNDKIRAKAGRRTSVLTTTNPSSRKLSHEKAKELDMNHIDVTFPSFLWAFTFIGPCSYFLWLKGTTILRIRKKLQKLGYLHPKPFDASEIVGRLILEGTMAVHYHSSTTMDGKKIGGFFYADFPIIRQDGSFYVADLFAVDIDLDTKKMVKAKLDDKVLTPSQTLNLCWYYTVSANHVKLHALANWGVNIHPGQVKENPFPARNSLVTVIYNYFGYSSFKNFIPTWREWGLLSMDWDPDSLMKTFDHGVKYPIWHHPEIYHLSKYSRLVNFIILVRSVFMEEFHKHGKCFPGVHGEALFVGSILHSLDHTTMDWNLEDPLWLDVDCPLTGKMAELGRIVKVGFVADVPGLYFHKRFKDAGHPFYDAVYKKAAKIDKKYADNMDTCIIK
mmetsp:Transcript_24585/g.56282  ORF Transcript_24585/g.56282 Transcript_24585/m.56282 type:complete len:489 (-) Transcript_24585:199-1665(-)